MSADLEVVGLEDGQVLGRPSGRRAPADRRRPERAPGVARRPASTGRDPAAPSTTRTSGTGRPNWSARAASTSGRISSHRLRWVSLGRPNCGPAAVGRDEPAGLEERLGLGPQSADHVVAPGLDQLVTARERAPRRRGRTAPRPPTGGPRARRPRAPRRRTVGDGRPPAPAAAAAGAAAGAGRSPPARAAGAALRGSGGPGRAGRRPAPAPPVAPGGLDRGRRAGPARPRPGRPAAARAAGAAGGGRSRVHRRPRRRRGRPTGGPGRLEPLDPGQQGGRRVVGLGMDQADQGHLEVDPGVGGVAHVDLGPAQVLHGPDQGGQARPARPGRPGASRSAPATVTSSGATRARKPWRRWSTRSTVSCWGLKPAAVRWATATRARPTSRSARASTTSSSSGRSSSTASDAATWSRTDRASRAEPRPRRTARSRASSPTSRWASSRTWASSSAEGVGPEEAELEVLGPAADGGQHLLGIGGGQDEDDVGRAAPPGS